jgi:hypothetical protein
MNVQFAAHGTDLSGFVVLHGTLAHAPPPEQQLLSLLHQRQRNPLHDGDSGADEAAVQLLVGPVDPVAMGVYSTVTLYSTALVVQLLAANEATTTKATSPSA